MAMADLDNDGDLDMISSRLGEEPAVYENRASAARIVVRLRDSAPNTQAIGAKLELWGGPVPQQQEIASGGNYLSGSDPPVMFAPSPENADHHLTITWPGGRLDSLVPNRIYEIYQDSVSVEQRPEPQRNETAGTDATMFEDVSERVGYVHHEQPSTTLMFSRCCRCSSASWDRPWSLATGRRSRWV